MKVPPIADVIEIEQRRTAELQRNIIARRLLDLGNEP